MLKERTPRRRSRSPPVTRPPPLACVWRDPSVLLRPRRLGSDASLVARGWRVQVAGSGGHGSRAATGQQRRA